MARSSDFRVEGQERLQKVINDLRAAGRGDLVKELGKALAGTVRQTITPATRQVARSTLPKRGGLAAKVAATPQTVAVRTSGGAASVRVNVGASRGTGARGSNRGFIRHPVFGNREVWVSQRTPRGWFTDTAKSKTSVVRADVTSVLDDFASRVERGL